MRGAVGIGAWQRGWECTVPLRTSAINDLLLRRDKGNTVLVVGRKPSVIAVADQAIDLAHRPAAPAATWS
jgi:hypothetical protein